jgi:hypothetical protein
MQPGLVIGWHQETPGRPSARTRSEARFPQFSSRPFPVFGLNMGEAVWSLQARYDEKRHECR